MEIKPKVVVQKQGFKILQKDEINRPFIATLRWKTAVDLDLHCMYRLKDGSTVTVPVKKGILGKIAGFFTGESEDFSSAARSLEGHIYFSNMGSKTRAPFIELDGDEGIGDTGGDNEENITFADIDKVEYAIIVANIFNKTTNFAQYNGSVIVKGAKTEFEVPLDDSQVGSWCVVAKLDNSGAETKLVNVNKTMRNRPNLSNFI